MGEVHQAASFRLLLPTAALDELQDSEAFRDRVIRAVAAYSMAGMEAERFLPQLGEGLSSLEAARLQGLLQLIQNPGDRGVAHLELLGDGADGVT